MYNNKNDPALSLDKLQFKHDIQTGKGKEKRAYPLNDIWIT